MPALSPTMEAGTIKEWLVKLGDKVEEGDEICRVETDKAVVSYDTLQEGIVAQILKPEGAEGVKVGDIIAVFVEEGEAWENLEYTVRGDSTLPVAPAAAEAPVKEEVKVAPVQTGSHMTFPSVRLLATQYGISDLSKITASGPKGAVTKGDILKYIKANNLKALDFSSAAPTASAAKTKSVAPPAPVVASVPSTPVASLPVDSSTYKDVEITQIRSVIAKRLTESKTQIPHQYTKVTCRMDTLNALRKSLRERGVKVSVNDFIIKSVAAALKKHPNVNQGAKGVTPDVDISVAVATDAGLITPIVKAADSRGLQDISATVRDLATRARDRKLLPEEFMGGSFTISNLGMFGIKEFSAVINPPQVCIMAVGGNKQTFVAVDDDLDNLELANYMTVQISSDGSKVNQSEVIDFLGSFKENMENPVNMIV